MQIFEDSHCACHLPRPHAPHAAWRWHPPQTGLPQTPRGRRRDGGQSPRISFLTRFGESHFRSLNTNFTFGSAVWSWFSSQEEKSLEPPAPAPSSCWLTPLRGRPDLYSLLSPEVGCDKPGPAPGPPLVPTTLAQWQPHSTNPKSWGLNLIGRRRGRQTDGCCAGHGPAKLGPRASVEARTRTGQEHGCRTLPEPSKKLLPPEQQVLNKVVPNSSSVSRKTSRVVPSQTGRTPEPDSYSPHSATGLSGTGEGTGLPLGIPPSL